MAKAKSRKSAAAGGGGIGGLITNFVAAIEAATFARVQATVMRVLGAGDTPPRRKPGRPRKEEALVVMKAARGKPGPKPKAVKVAPAPKKPGRPALGKKAGRPAVGKKQKAPARGTAPKVVRRKKAAAVKPVSPGSTTASAAETPLTAAPPPAPAILPPAE